MEPISTTPIRTIAVGSLSVIDLDSASDNDAGGETDHEQESVNDAERSDNDVQAEGTGTSRENDDKDVAEESNPADRPAPKKIKKHRPMKAAEQITAIAALKEKLATDFTAPPQPTKTDPFPTKVTEKRAKKKPINKAVPPLPAPTNDDAAETKQKRKLGPKPKQPRPQKRTKKEPVDRLMVGITPAVKAQIERLAKLGQSSTVKDVENVVTAAGDILDEGGPDGETYDVEIERLLAQETGWKNMAEQGDEGLRESVKKFMERYGIIPMGAVEVVDGRMNVD